MARRNMPPLLDRISDASRITVEDLEQTKMFPGT
jgi:hypothetical protein